MFYPLKYCSGEHHWLVFLLISSIAKLSDQNYMTYTHMKTVKGKAE